MSIAAAQRALSKANRNTLQQTAKGKIGSSLMQDAGSIFSDVVGIADETLNLSENMNAWDEYEAGQEYLGIENKNSPLKASQKYLKKPKDVFTDSVDVGGTINKSFTSSEITGIGSLASSDLSDFYSNFMDGDLSSKVGTPLNAMADPEMKEAGGGGMPDLGAFITPDEKARRQTTGTESYSQQEQQHTNRSLVPSSDVKAYDKTTSPNYSNLPEINTQSLTDEWKNTKVVNDKSFKEKGLTHGGSGLGSKKGNIAVAKALNEKGIKGKSLSQMIPGWRDMEYEEKMEAIQSLGVGPEEMWAQLNKKKSVKNKPPM